MPRAGSRAHGVQHLWSKVVERPWDAREMPVEPRSEQVAERRLLDLVRGGRGALRQGRRPLPGRPRSMIESFDKKLLHDTPWILIDIHVS